MELVAMNLTIFPIDKKASYGTCIHPDVASDSHIPVTYMR